MIKVLFAGSPDAAAVTLEKLIEAQGDNFLIAGVLSNPPTAKGRHSELLPTPVAQMAQTHQIPVFTPEHLDSAAREQILPLKADLLISFAYGHIFGPKFLAMFPMGGVNLHPSLLPKYRGCTPVPAAILNRDIQTGITIQKLALKMDEGDILAQTIVDLNGTETNESLLNYAATEGAGLLLTVLTKAAKEGKLSDGKAQVGEPSYTSMITKENGKIDWNKSAAQIDAMVRAYYPEPGTWCMDNGQTLRILQAIYIEETDAKAIPFANEIPGKVLQFSKPEGIYIKTGNGILIAKTLQKQGKKSMNYKDFMNGARDFIGSVLQ